MLGSSIENSRFYILPKAIIERHKDHQTHDNLNPSCFYRKSPFLITLGLLYGNKLQRFASKDLIIGKTLIDNYQFNLLIAIN